MGINDWKSKNPEEYTAEDWFWHEYDEMPPHPFCCKFQFIFNNFRYVVWEDCVVCKCQKEDKSNDNYLEEKKFDDFESMMLDPCWDGLSLSDMMSKIPYYDLF